MCAGGSAAGSAGPSTACGRAGAPCAGNGGRARAAQAGRPFTLAGLVLGMDVAHEAVRQLTDVGQPRGAAFPTHLEPAAARFSSMNGSCFKSTRNSGAVS